MSNSICMATHNGAKYLAQQIDSILPQLGMDDELIISDDGSTDATRAIISSYHDSRIRMLGTRTFGTPTRNFEHALAQSSGDYIFLADQDDIWHAGKVNMMAATLETCDLVVCDCRLVDQELRPLHNSFFARNRSKSGLLKNLVKNSFVGCCMAFRRTVLERSLPFPDNIPQHDQWIGLVAERHFRVKFIPEVLVDHRRHAENYSTTGGASRFSTKKKIKLRFQLARKLFAN